MAKTKKEMMVAWLNDAHAMELSLVKNMEQQVKDADEEGMSDVKERLLQHIEETRSHAEQVRICVERLGGKVSKGKDVLGKMFGFIQGSMKSMFMDAMVRSAVESYAAENLEIASYTSIMSAATEMGDTETVSVCNEILEDERRMAEWALEQVTIASSMHIAMHVDEEE